MAAVEVDADDIDIRIVADAEDGLDVPDTCRGEGPLAPAALWINALDGAPGATAVLMPNSWITAFHGAVGERSAACIHSLAARRDRRTRRRYRCRWPWLVLPGAP